MKRLLTGLLVFASTLGAAHAGPLDPQYKDGHIDRIHGVFRMNGALELDEHAVKGGANEWTIKVREVELKGETPEALDAAWQSLIKRKKKKILKDLKEMSVVDESTTELSDELAEQVSKTHNVTFFIQEGHDHVETREWIRTQLLTRAGRANAAHLFDDAYKYRKKLDYFRFHYDDQNSEVIGDDLLMIRGFKKVIIVEISYVHA